MNIPTAKSWELSCAANTRTLFPRGRCRAWRKNIKYFPCSLTCEPAEATTRRLTKSSELWEWRKAEKNVQRISFWCVEKCEEFVENSSRKKYKRASRKRKLLKKSVKNIFRQKIEKKNRKKKSFSHFHRVESNTCFLYLVSRKNIKFKIYFHCIFLVFTRFFSNLFVMWRVFITIRLCIP